jgi:hypothetical protein
VGPCQDHCESRARQPISAALPRSLPRTALQAVTRSDPPPRPQRRPLCHRALRHAAKPGMQVICERLKDITPALGELWLHLHARTQDEWRRWRIPGDPEDGRRTIELLAPIVQCNMLPLCNTQTRWRKFILVFISRMLGLGKCGTRSMGSGWVRLWRCSTIGPRNRAGARRSSFFGGTRRENEGVWVSARMRGLYQGEATYVGAAVSPAVVWLFGIS